MANKIQLKRGLKSKLPTLSQGEPAYTTDTREFFMGTGSGNVNMGGSQWHTGTAMSGTSTSTTYYYSACPQVKVGDMFLNTTYGYVYQCSTAGSGTTARWTYKGSIKGAKGDEGDKGKDASFDGKGIITLFRKCIPSIKDGSLDGYYKTGHDTYVWEDAASQASGTMVYFPPCTGPYDNLEELYSGKTVMLYKDSEKIAQYFVNEGNAAIIQFISNNSAWIVFQG